MAHNLILTIKFKAKRMVRNGFNKERLNFWKTKYLEWKSSNLSKAAFCRQHQLTASAFYGWCRRIVKLDNPAENRQTSNQSPMFFPIQLEEKSHLPNVTSKPLIIEFPNGIKVSGDASLDLAYLERLMPILMKERE